MTFSTIQKVIKIGTSRGVTLPSKELKRMNVQDNDELEITVRKKVVTADSNNVRQVADDLLKRYKDDFTNLANR